MTMDDVKKEIIPVLKRYRIKKAGVFGSVAKGLEREDSDIDILVEFGVSNTSLLDFIRIKLELEAALKRKVDLVEYSAIKPILRNKILAEEVSVL
jgi:predicted nucleotidyltransferase